MSGSGAMRKVWRSGERVLVHETRPKRRVWGGEVLELYAGGATVLPDGAPRGPRAVLYSEMRVAEGALKGRAAKAAKTARLDSAIRTARVARRTADA